MKFLCAIWCVFIIASLTGFALGDEESVDHGDTTSADADVLMDKLINCFQDDLKILKNGINASHNIEEYRNVFKTACDKLPTISVCTANVTSNVHTYLNETFTASFKVSRNGLDTMMTVTCQEDGVKTAAIFEEIRNLNERSVDNITVIDCLRQMENYLHVVDGNDPSKVSITLFRMFEFAKTCIAESRHDDQIVLNNLVESLFSDIMKKLKCIHPDSHTEVLCDTFYNN